MSAARRNLKEAVGSKDNSDLDHTLTGAVTDGLSIRDYAIALKVGDVSYGLEGDPDDRMVDAYNADPLTTSQPLSQNITLPFLALQEDTDPVKVSDIEVTVRDQADRSDEGTDGVVIAAKEEDLAKSAFAEPDGMEFTVIPEDKDDASTLTIEAEVTSPYSADVDHLFRDVDH